MIVFMSCGMDDGWRGCKVVYSCGHGHVLTWYTFRPMGIDLSSELVYLGKVQFEVLSGILSGLLQNVNLIAKKGAHARRVLNLAMCVIALSEMNNNKSKGKRSKTHIGEKSESKLCEISLCLIYRTSKCRNVDILDGFTSISVDDFI